MTTVIIIVLLVLILLVGFMLLAIGLATRGRVIAVDAKVQVICDELGVVVPVIVGYEENTEEQVDASQITR